MQRKVFLLGAGAAVAAILLLALGSQAPAVHADESSMSWDTAMDDPPTGIGTCTNNDNNVIETGECPTVETGYWLQTRQLATSDESFFDLATVVWTVDGVTTSTTEDLNGDTTPDPGYVIPVNGLRATPGNLGTLGATVGHSSFYLASNVVPASIAFANNVDDVWDNSDATVLGQPPTCNTTTANPKLVDFSSTFDIWASTLDTTKVVANEETQEDNYSDGEDCSAGGGTPDGMPDGIHCTPQGVIDLLDVTGLTPYYEGRGYGIAEIALTVTVSTYTDVNFLDFNMLDVPGVDGYLNVSIIGYPATVGLLPTHPDYSVYAQTVATCPPYYSVPVIYGITQSTDFPGPPAKHVDGGGIARQVMGASESGPFDYYITKSVSEDYDGDTIADIYDRCRTDPATGSATDDLDGDTLTGTCETTGASNGESYGCAETGETPTASLPWATCQDVDGDDILNAVDNCPNHPNANQVDTDGDTVGDVCEIDLGFDKDTPGDGDGYPSPAPGIFLDHDNTCIDQFCIGRPEPAAEAGSPPGGCTDEDPEGKYCYVNEAQWATTQPYVNPPLASLNLTYNDSSDDGEPDYLDIDSDTVVDYMDLDDDSDGDKQSNACEGKNGTDPLDAASKSAGTLCAPVRDLDCDGDTLKDADEETEGTDPFNPDSDGGGCLDGAEVEFGSDPLNGADDALDGDADTLPDCGDSDADSCEAYQEDAQGYSDYNWYDFYDVPVPANPDPTANGTKNAAINMGDVGAVLFYVPTAPGAANPNANGVHYDSVKGSCDWDADTTPDAEGMCYDRASSTAPNPPWEANAPSGAVNMGDVGAVLAQVPGTCGSLK